MAIDTDIHGAGIFGLSIAWELTRRGARVRVIERRRPGAGSSGGLVGALAPHTPDRWNEKKAFQLRGLLAAPEFWAEVEEVAGRSVGYARIGRLMPIDTDHALSLARARIEDARQNWGAAANWRVEKAARWPGWAPDAGTGWLVHDTLSARLHPARAIEALTLALRARGVEILEQAVATPTPGAARGGDAGAAGAVVLATGHEGLAALTQEFGRPIGVGVKGQAAAFRATAPRGAPQLYAGGLHVIPHDGGTIAIGSTSEREWSREGPDAALEELVDVARQRVPLLRDAPVVARWAGIRPRSATRAPLLGPHPDRPGVFIANGGFKIGFGIAPEVARVMAELILEGRDLIPPDFTPEAILTPRKDTR